MIYHINSVARKSLNNKTAYDVAEILLDNEILKKLGLLPIEPNSVDLNNSTSSSKSSISSL